MLRLEEEDIYAGIATSGSGGGGGGSSTKYGASIDNFLGDVDENGVLQAPSGEGVKNLSFDDVVDIGSVVKDSTVMSSLLSYKFYGAQNIGAVSFPVLTYMRIESMYGAFAYSSVTSLSFPKLTTISGYVINNEYTKGIAEGCSSLTSVSFDALTTISIWQGFVRAFRECTSLTSVGFPELTTIDSYGVFGSSSYGGAFEKCTSLTTVTFPKLSSMTPSNVFQTTFKGCTSLTSVSFPALTSTSFGGSTNQFNRMLSGCTGVTVHFPSNLQSVIGSWSDVTAGFGGTNTTVLFDLPATE